MTSWFQDVSKGTKLKSITMPQLFAVCHVSRPHNKSKDSITNKLPPCIPVLPLSLRSIAAYNPILVNRLLRPSASSSHLEPRAQTPHSSASATTRAPQADPTSSARGPSGGRRSTSARSPWRVAQERPSCRALHRATALGTRRHTEVATGPYP